MTSFLSRLLGRSPITKYENEFPKIGQEIPCNDGFSIVVRAVDSILHRLGRDTPSRLYAVLLKGPTPEAVQEFVRKSDIGFWHTDLPPPYDGCKVIQPDGTAFLDNIAADKTAQDELLALAERFGKHGIKLPIDAIHAIVTQDMKNPVKITAKRMPPLR